MKKRIGWIDSLRGIAMFFVIFGHAFYRRNNKIRNYIYSFHMPLFFFISGLTTKRSDMTLLQFLKKKCKDLLLPYLALNVFVFIYKITLQMAFGMYSTLTLKTSVEFTIKGFSSAIPCIQSWFILALFVIDLMFFILTKLFKNDIFVTIAVIIIFVLAYMYKQTGETYLQYWHIDTAMFGLLFYYLGYVLMKYYHKIEKFISNYWSLIIVVIVIPIAHYIQYINGRVSMNLNNYKDINYFLASSILSIIAIVVLANVFMKKDKFFSKIGVMSLFYLGYHGFLMIALKTYAPDILENDLYTFLVAAFTYLVMYYPSKFVYKNMPILIGKFKGETV